jgi:hypothetical protein
MRLLLDNNLFPRLVGVLVGVGWDIVRCASSDGRRRTMRSFCALRGMVIGSWSVLTLISVFCLRSRVSSDRQWSSFGGSSVDEWMISPHY